MKRWMALLFALLFPLALAACSAGEADDGSSTAMQSVRQSVGSERPESSSAAGPLPQEPEKEENEMETNQLYLKIGENTLTAVLEDNASAAALKELLADEPLTISASNYGGFEKVCALGTDLPRSDVQTTTHAGDICLYSGNQIVIFYGSNTWAYTRLGSIPDADASELEQVLSGAENEITLSLKAFD